MIPDAPNTPGPDEGDLLQNCPRCGYSLHGLPIEHACPECAFAFDRRWRIFGGEGHQAPASRRWSAALLEGALVIDPIIGLIIVAAVFFAGGLLVGCVVLSLCLVIAGIHTLVALSSSKPEGFITLGPDGVEFHSPREKSTAKIPWSSIRRATSGHFSRKLRIETTDTTLDICCEHYFGNWKREISRCARTINRQVRSSDDRQGQ